MTGGSTQCAGTGLRFCPGIATTRDHIGRFLKRLLGWSDITIVNVFTDLAGKDDELVRAAEYQWWQGYTNGATECTGTGLRYCPDIGLTRAHAAAFMSRSLGYVTVSSRCATLTTTVNPANAGNVLANPVADCPVNAAKYRFDTNISLTANPNAGYQFNNWTGNVSGMSNPITIQVGDGVKGVNKAVTANFDVETVRFYGQVTYQDGSPYPGVVIGVTQGEYGNHETTTDSSGSYALVIPAGRYLISAYDSSNPGIGNFSPTADELGWIDIPPSRRIDFRANFSGATPPPNSGVLDVRYVDQVYVQQTLNPKGYWDMCGPSSTAMFLHYEGAETRDILNNRQATLDLRCELQTNPPNDTNCWGETYWDPLVDAIRSRNVSVEGYRWGPTFSEIKQSIDNNHPVILGIHVNRLKKNPETGAYYRVDVGHIVLVVGYGENETLILNDPYGEAYWWDVLYPNRVNVPPSATQPMLNGRQVTVQFSDITRGFVVFREGAAAPAAPQSLQVSDTGGTLIGANVHVQFSESTVLRSFNSTQVITVTHQPQRQPTHETPSIDTLINTFKLTAMDQNGNVVENITTGYTLTIKIDPTILSIWSPATGWTTPGDEVIDKLGYIARFKLLAWDSASSSWIEVPYSVEQETETLVAYYSQFTEFAVGVKGYRSVYLPLIMK